MDQDGANLKMLTDGKNLVLTPRFDNKSQRAIYVSYQKKIPCVYVLDIETGLQKRVGKFSGLTFAPRFAPDGHSAILSVARNGSTNIFSINLHNNNIIKLTHDIGAINTSPSYSPDGSKIVFNSDRAGSRQLYIMDSNGANITRISKGDGSYATPVWSPRGNLIAFTKIANGSFYIGVMRPDGSGEKLLTSSWLDEAPAWAPNGQVIIFTRQKPDGSSTLHSVNVTGYNERLIHVLGNASEPSWSALLQ
jgi:TolB protein